jgi:AraC family transcriptional regulator of arabinose operon
VRPPPQLLHPGQLLPPRLRVLYGEPIGDRRLTLRGCGVREWMPPGFVDRPLGTPDVLIVTFRHPVVIRTESGDRRVAANATLLSQPHSPHYFGADDHPWCHSWLHCEGDDVRELLFEAALPLDVPLPESDPRCLDRCVLALHEEARAHLPPDTQIMRNHLQTLLRELTRSHAREAPVVPRPLLELRDHLDATFAESHSLSRLAARLGCSVPHLCNRFRQSFRTSPIAYVIELRLRHARFLLADRSRSVAEVASAVGYGEYPHFSKLFFRRFGRWPSQERLIEVVPGAAGAGSHPAMPTMPA